MKWFFNLLLCAFAGPLLFAQSSVVFDDLEMYSEVLGQNRKYAVYLPPGYEDSQRSYPVLYLLHGWGDDQSGWIQFGEIQRIMDETLESGLSTPLIVIMPDADTQVKGYRNSVDGKWRYEDFFIDELMPFVEKKYRIRAEKRFRAVAGLSMGGGGAMIYALHHPELFSSSCPLSASLGALSWEAFLSEYKGEVRDEKRLRAYYDKYSALEWLEGMDVEKANSVDWYIDCGDDDYLYEGNSLVHIAMKKKGIEHEYRVRDGDHTWTYWRASLYEVLRFVSDRFHQY